MKTVRWWVATAALGALVGLPGVVGAGDEKGQPQEEGPKDEKPKQAPVTVSASNEGFTIQSEGGDFKLKVTGYLQLDGRFFASDDAKAAVDTFVLRRVRPIVQGTVGRAFDFVITPDFGDGKTVLQDAYLDARYVPWLRVRVGKFKTPVGLERLQSATGILFVERAFPTSIAPNRDLGAQVHGEIAEGVAAYALGVFNGVADGGSADGDVNGGKDVAARLFLLPFKKSGIAALKGLGIGIAGTTGKQEGTTLPVLKTAGQQTFFSYAAGVAAAGSRTRFEPQASYQYGPVRLLGEYIRSRQRLTKGAQTLDVTSDAWQAAGAVILTGETPSAGVVTPRRPFEPGKGWGAVELAARFTSLEVDAGAFGLGFADATKSARRARAWAVGLNWYLNRNLKQVVDFERTTFSGGATGGSRPAENAILFRSQIAF